MPGWSQEKVDGSCHVRSVADDGSGRVAAVTNIRAEVLPLLPMHSLSHLDHVESTVPVRVASGECRSQHEDVQRMSMHDSSSNWYSDHVNQPPLPEKSKPILMHLRGSGTCSEPTASANDHSPCQVDIPQAGQQPKHASQLQSQSPTLDATQAEMKAIHILLEQETTEPVMPVNGGVIGFETCKRRKTHHAPGRASFGGTRVSSLVTSAGEVPLATLGDFCRGSTATTTKQATCTSTTPDWYHRRGRRCLVHPA